MDPNTLSWWSQIPFHLDNTLVTLFGGSIFTFGSDPLGGGLPVRYYGLMYLLAFFTCFKSMKFFIRRDKLNIPDAHMDGLLTWVVLGILICARLGYVLFYNFDYYFSHPLEILMPIKNGQFTGIAGMSYHGGLIGATLGGYLFIRKEKIQFVWKYLNVAFLCAPLGYTWGRLGNFLNGELYGRPTDSWIGMVFPSDEKHLMRYPSQLFEMFGEGLFLFAVLLFLRRFEWSKNMMFPLYVIGYGSVRFVIEFFREPDAQLGLLSFGMSRGQELCSAMILIGVTAIFLRRVYLAKHPEALEESK